MSHPKLDKLLDSRPTEKPSYPFEAALRGRIIGDDEATTAAVIVTALLDRTAVIAQGDEYRLVRRVDLTANPTTIRWRPLTTADGATLAARKRSWVGQHLNGTRSPAA